jgi:hypothetical protein
MPINPMIPLQGRPFEPPDFLGSMKSAMSLRAFQADQERQTMDTESRQRAVGVAEARTKIDERRAQEEIENKIRDDSRVVFEKSAPGISLWLREAGKDEASFTRLRDGLQVAAELGKRAGYLPPEAVVPETWSPELGPGLTQIADAIDKTFAPKVGGGVQKMKRVGPDGVEYEFLVGPSGEKIGAEYPQAPAKPSVDMTPQPIRIGDRDTYGVYNPTTKSWDEVTGGTPPNAAGSEPEMPGLVPSEPESQNILSQTGLTINAFRLLTGQAGQLARDKVTRAKAASEAQEWARKNDVDISTLPSQYKAYNDVLAANIARLNNTKMMEGELQGTVENIRKVATDNDLSKLRFVNVLKVWAGQEVNDSLAQQYALHLGQLRNELSAYYAATQGRTGNNITLSDQNDAAMIIRNGVSTGSLDGLEAAIRNSTDKMGKVMEGSVDRSRKAVWGLFGVGKNYKDSATQPSSGNTSVAPKMWDGKSTPADGMIFDSPSGKKLKYVTVGGKSGWVER